MFVGINVFFLCFSQKKELSKIGLDGGKRKAELAILLSFQNEIYGRGDFVPENFLRRLALQ